MMQFDNYSTFIPYINAVTACIALLVYVIFLIKYRSSIKTGFNAVKLIPRVNVRNLHHYYKDTGDKEYDELQQKNLNPRDLAFERVAPVVCMPIALLCLCMPGFDLNGNYWISIMAIILLIMVIGFIILVHPKDDNVLQRYADLYDRYIVEKKSRTQGV